MRMWVRVAQIGFVAALAIGFVAAFNRYGYMGPDYYYHYRAATADVFAGQTQLYDGQTVSFPVLPWAVMLLAPLLLLPLKAGQGALIVLTLGSMALYLLETTRDTADSPKLPPHWLVLTMLTTPLVDLLIRGNYEGYLMLGMALAWLGWRHERPLLLGVGLAILVTKPIHMPLVGLFFALAVLRNWPPRAWVWVVLPTLAALVGSVWAFGLDWPLRYVQYNAGADIYADLSLNNPTWYLQAALWRFFDEGLGLSPRWGYGLSALVYVGLAVMLIRERRFDTHMLALVTAGSVAFSVYVQGYHYVLIAPAFALIVWRNPRWALILWPLSLTPFLRGAWGFQHVWLDNAYALAVFGVMAWVFAQVRRNPQQP